MAIYLIILCEPLHLVSMNLNLLILLSLINVYIPPTTETIFKQIFFFSCFNPEFFFFNFFETVRIECQKIYECLDHLNLYNRGLYYSTSFVNIGGSVTSLFIIILVVRIAFSYISIALHRSKYRKYYRIILVNVHSKY